MAAVLLALTLLARPAPAAEGLEARDADYGTVALLAGLRHVPQEPLLRGFAEAGTPVGRRTVVSPAAAVALAYRVDRTWTAALEFGGGRDTYHFASGGRLDVNTAFLAMAGRYSFRPGPRWLEPYLQLGAGYHLSVLQDSGPASAAPPVVQEANVMGVSCGAGTRFLPGGPFGLLLDLRWSFAGVPLVERPVLESGGLSLLLGVEYLWGG